MELFPQKLRNLWSEWELRLMILLSLFLQMTLIIVGKRRKYVCTDWVRAVVWLAYLSADGVAIASLGILSNNDTNRKNCNVHSLNPNNVLIAFWCPFLLLHLGGPDTITAYSLEDNALWKRHFLQLLVQVGGSFYIFLKFWTGNWLSFLTIPIFLVGIIKYGERIWVLKCAHTKHSIPRNHPFFPKFEFSSADNTRGSSILLDAHWYLKFSEFLFIDIMIFPILSTEFAFQNCDWEHAFKVIEIELGLMYDLLYTKATLVYTRLGCILRLITLSTTILVLLVFFIMIHNDEGIYSATDVNVTYVLLFGAIALEIYAVLVLLSSDWTAFWSVSRTPPNINPPKTLVSLLISCFQLCGNNQKRWSNSIEQFNFLNFCLNNFTTTFGKKIQKFFGVDDMLNKYHTTSYGDITDDLKELIFEQINKKYIEITDPDIPAERQEMCDHRGDWVLENHEQLHLLDWSVLEVEFSRSILLWHIATDICYHKEIEINTNNNNSDVRKSKVVSDYMLYLLVMRPSILLFSRSVGKRFQQIYDTCYNIARQKTSEHRDKSLYDFILERAIPSENDDLIAAKRLFNSLQELAVERRWKMISEVWVEMLCHAATLCKGDHHAQQLRRGGGLLTHVWILMAHFCILPESKEFRDEFAPSSK